MLKFILSNELVSACKQLNSIETGKLDNTCKHRSKCVNVVPCACGLVDHIEGCQHTECDETLINNHRGYLVNINIEKFCNSKLNECN